LSTCIDLHRTLALLLAAVAVTAISVGAGAVATAADAKVPKGPSGAAFYKPPKKLPKGHGKIIWQRDSTKLAPVAGAKVNKTILYTSKSPQGKTIAVSGSLSIPPGKPPKGGWPVITWAHATTGAADSCAPTRVRPGSAVAPDVTYVDSRLESLIDAGYAIVRTDFPGLGTPGPHPYLIGESEGRAVLDIVAAARQYKPSLGKRFLIAGHSQGGQSALFAASLAKSWSPQLKLRGVAAYAPGSHVYEQAQLLPLLTAPNPLSGLAALILKGAATTSKQIDPDELLSSDAAALYPEVEQVCLSELSQPDSFGGIAPADLFADGVDLGPLYGVLQAMNPALEIPVPVLLLQGEADTAVFLSLTNMLDTELRDAGDDVDYHTYPGVDHYGVVDAAKEVATEYFESRLPGGR